MSGHARTIAHAGVIAATYAALTLVVIQSPLGYGPVQFRLSEALTVVACLTPAAIPGLWIGAVVANAFMLTQFGALGLLDVVFGAGATLIGAWWTWRHHDRPVVALAGPVLANALVVPAYLPLMLTGATGLDFYRLAVFGLDMSGSWWSMYLFGFVAVGLGQAVVVYGLGLPLLGLLKRLGVGGALTEPDQG
ncbi:MAG: QueT transporter family protein [Actinobacteria bacterium]|nr:QueT transporter family protein [Actinomycetota bacterium]